MKTPRSLILGLALVTTACLDGATDVIGPPPIGGAVAAIPPTNNTACNVQWASAVSGNWTDATKWNPQVVPGPTSSVCIAVAGTYTVSLDPAVDATPVDILALDIGAAGATPTLRLGGTSATLNVTEGIVVQQNATLWINTGTAGVINAGGTVTNSGTIDSFVSGGAGGVGNQINADLINLGTLSSRSFALTLAKVDGQYSNSGTVTFAATSSNLIIPATAGNPSFSQDGGVITGAANFETLEMHAGTFYMNGGKARQRSATIPQPIVVIEGAALVLGPSISDSAVIGLRSSSTVSSSLSGNPGALTTLWISNVDATAGTTSLTGHVANAGKILLAHFDGGSGNVTIGGNFRLTNNGTVDAVATGGTPTFHFAAELTNNGTLNVGEDISLDKATGLYINNGTISGAGTIFVLGNTFSSTASGTVAVTGSSASTNFQVDAGRLIGFGTVGDVVLANGGTVEPGSSAGWLTANTLNVATGTSLKIELGGTQVGTGYDQMALVLSPNTPGSLDLSEINGFLSGVCGQQFDVLTHNAPGGYGGFGTYNGLTPAANRALRVINKQTVPKMIQLYGYDPTVKVSVAPNPVAIAEGSAGVQYAVCLDGAPALSAGQTVSVSAVANAQVTVAPPSVTFTSADWFAPKFFTVTAVDDNLNEGNHTGTVTHTATSATVAAYNNVAVASLTANITDNDVPPPSSTTTGVSSNNNPSTVGQSVTFTATVSSGGGTPDGSVQFKVDGNDVGSPVTLASGQAQFITSALQIGNHTVQAVYGGSSGFLTSNGSLAGGQQVNAIATTTTVGSSANPSTFGQSVTFTTTVSSGGSTPTGSVQWNVDNVDVGGPVALNGGGEATLVTSSLGAGSHAIKATYAASGNFAGSFGALVGGQTVNPAGTSTGVSSNNNPSTAGQSVTFTATVTSGAGTPTGSVQWNIDNSNVGGLVTLDGSGQATLTTSALSVGSHTIQATYGSATNFAASNGTLSGGQNVNSGNSNTAVGSSLNPSTFGQLVTFTATVSGGLGTPTGTVQWNVDNSDVGSPVNLDGSGQATLTTSTLAAGNHAIKATYSGGGAYGGSIGLLSGGQNVSAVGTSTGVGSSLNPSTFGQSVTFTATVSSGAGTPTGSVQFNVDNVDVGGLVALSGGQATYVTSTLGAGSHTVKATYAVNGNFAGSNGSVSQTVNPAGTSTSVVSNLNPSGPGQMVTFTATVGASVGTPTGTIQFNIDNANVGSPVTLSGGQATYQTATLGVATHTVKAKYLGATNYSGSEGTLAGGQVVNGESSVTPTTTIASVTLSPQYSDMARLQASVSPHTSGSSEATGTVHFYWGATAVSCGTSAPPDEVGNDDLDNGVAYIERQLLGAAGNSFLTACFYSTNADFGSSGGNTQVYVGKEQAKVQPTASNPSAVLAVGAMPSASFSLGFTLRETNPETDINAGALPGDVDNAGLTVNLLAVGSGANNKTVACLPSATIATPPAYGDVKTFTCNFSGVAVDAYEVSATVTGDYYVGGYVDALTVYDPNGKTVSGGGKFVYSATSTDIVSFALSYVFTGKDNKPRGNFIAIRHLANGDECRAKSNGVGAPAVSGNTASFSGKGNYSCTRPDGSTYDGAGNLSFVGWVQDNDEGESASGPDKAWLKIDAPNSSLAMPTPAAANARPLTNGNVQVK